MNYILIQTKKNIEQIESVLIDTLSDMIDFSSWEKKGNTIFIFTHENSDLLETIFMNLSTELLVDFKVFISSMFSAIPEETIRLLEKIEYHQTLILDDKKLHAILMDKIDKSYLKLLILRDLSKDYLMVQTIRVYLESNQNALIASKKLYIHRNTLTQRLDKLKQKTGYDLKNFKDAFMIYYLVK